MTKTKKHRDRLLDCVANIITQWITPGDDFKIGGYRIKRGEIVERLRLMSFENLEASPREMHDFSEGSNDKELK